MNLTGDSSKRKLIIQIPCYNEAQTLPITFRAIPKTIEGYDIVETLVIDDGSKDGTAECARRLGVHHVVSHGYNLGLAQTFITGIETAIRLGAHTIVNLDADNQYCADDIPVLVRPITTGEAVVVIGTRPNNKRNDFSATKKFFEYAGSKIVGLLSKTSVPDVASGFRAIHHDVAKQLYILSRFTYTLEMIIQLGARNIPIHCVPIRVNEGALRKSRLMKSPLQYVCRSAIDIVRMFVFYRPAIFFSCITAILAFGCILIGKRYLHFMGIGEGKGHIQSLLLGIVFALSAVMSMLIWLVCDSINSTRILLEKIRYQLNTLMDKR